MRGIQHEDCALCRRDATFVWTDHANRKFFDCGDCGKYEITNSALRRLDREQQGIWRSQIAADARSLRDDPDCRLLIDMDENHQLRCSKVRKEATVAHA